MVRHRPARHDHGAGLTGSNEPSRPPRRLDTLFNAQNANPSTDHTSIPATCLRVTAAL